MKRTSLLECDAQVNDQGGFAFRRKRLGAAVGAKGLGVSWFEIQPGKKAFPFHYHLANDEAVFVLEGEGVLRSGEEETPLRPRDYQRRPQALGPRFETRGVLLILIVIGVIFALFIAAWKFGSDNNTPRLVGVNQAAPVTKHKAAAKPMARLVLTATNGDSWLLVRANSASGPTKYQGTLQQGQQLPFTKKPFLYRRIWIAAAKPQNLVARLNGHLTVIPGAGRGKAAQFIVTPKAISKVPPRT